MQTRRQLASWVSINRALAPAAKYVIASIHEEDSATVLRQSYQSLEDYTVRINFTETCTYVRATYQYTVLFILRTNHYDIFPLWNTTAQIGEELDAVSTMKHDIFSTGFHDATIHWTSAISHRVHSFVRYAIHQEPLEFSGVKPLYKQMPLLQQREIIDREMRWLIPIGVDHLQALWEDDDTDSRILDAIMDYALQSSSSALHSQGLDSVSASSESNHHFYSSPYELLMTLDAARRYWQPH